MFVTLPSLSHFQPHFLPRGPMRFHLPFLYDLVAITKPQLIVTVGFADGGAHFTFCQAVREQRLTCQCIATAIDAATISEDAAWRQGVADCKEYYGDFARLLEGTPVEVAQGFSDDTVELLLIDDSDSAAEIRAAFDAWHSKLKPGATVLLHGIGQEREQGPAEVWGQLSAGCVSAAFELGIGLGVTRPAEASSPRPSDPFESFLGGVPRAEAADIYAIAAKRICAEARADEAARQKAALEARQHWLDSIVNDRWKAQQTIEHQVRSLAFLEEKLATLHRDRDEVQLVIDHQRDQVNELLREAAQLHATIEALKVQLKEQKRVVTAAKKSCRKKGRCLRVDSGLKAQRRLGEKIARELRRLPRNLAKLLLGREASP